jgi:endonuclease YncB( thermonuclease family)
VIAGQRVRLWGIDAPDLDQPCMDGDRLPYRCGVTARMVLDALTRTREVVCGIAENSTDAPPLAVCRAGDSDLGALMVATGYAFDRPDVSGGLYAGEEAQAAGRKAGLWAGAFVKPADWRRDRRRG